MILRKHLARILRKAAAKLDPPRSLSDLARDQNRDAPPCKLGPEGPVNTGYTDPAELVKFGRDALARMSHNMDAAPRGSTVDEVTQRIAERLEAERRIDK